MFVCIKLTRLSCICSFIIHLLHLFRARCIHSFPLSPIVFIVCIILFTSKHIITLRFERFLYKLSFTRSLPSNNKSMVLTSVTLTERYPLCHRARFVSKNY